MKSNLLFVCGFIAITFLNAQSFVCGVDSLYDVRDGKRYPTVQIGSQCWMKQNLNYGRFIMSTTSAVQHSDASNNSIVEKYCMNNDSIYCDTLGGLYDWDEMMDYSTSPGQGICPAGWHLPTDAEFTTMVTLTGNNGNALKALGVGMIPNGIGTNTSGFSALGGGDRDGVGVFYGLDLRYIFWTSTEFDIGVSWQYTLFAENDSIAHLNDAGKPSAFSVRCIRDVETSGLQEEFKGTQFVVFPNPSSEKLLIQSFTNQLLHPVQIKIYTLAGQLIGTKTFNNFPIEIDVHELQKGIYFVELISGSKIEVQKVIIN